MLSTVKYFSHPYPYSIGETGLNCAKIPKDLLKVGLWQTCMAAAAPLKNVATAMCECKQLASLNGQCSFANPVLGLAACVLDVLPLFGCKEDPVHPHSYYITDKSYDYSISLPYTNNARSIPFDKLSKIHTVSLHVLFTAVMNQYIDGLNRSCHGEDIASGFRQKVLSSDSLIPNWKTRSQFIPKFENEGQLRLRFPMATILTKDDSYNMSNSNSATQSAIFLMRGTATYADVLADVDYALVEGIRMTPDGLEMFDGMHYSVGRGFQGIASIFFEDVLTFITNDAPDSNSLFNDYRKDGKKVSQLIITGHSLGGFSASVLGLLVNGAISTYKKHHKHDLSHLADDFAVKVVSFSSDRVGDDRFASIFNQGSPSTPPVYSNILQFHLDPVTSLPCHALPACPTNHFYGVFDSGVSNEVGMSKSEVKKHPQGLKDPMDALDFKRRESKSHRKHSATEEPTPFIETTVGEYSYGQLNGVIPLSRRDGHDEFLPLPAKSLYIWRNHVCAYECALRKSVGEVNPDFCSSKKCADYDFSLWAKRVPVVTHEGLLLRGTPPTPYGSDRDLLLDELHSASVQMDFEKMGYLMEEITLLDEKPSAEESAIRT